MSKPEQNNDQVETAFQEFVATTLLLGDDMLGVRNSFPATHGELRDAYFAVLDDKFQKMIQRQDRFRLWLCNWMAEMTEKRYTEYCPHHLRPELRSEKKE